VNLDTLFAVVRKDSVDTSTMEEHFETRLMAKIAELRERPTAWFMSVWRMIPVFAVLTALIAVCSITFVETRPDDLFATITTGQEDLMARSFLPGE
jgi:hypothetical protein